MNKSDLIEAVTERTDLAKKDAEKAVKAVFQTIEEALGKGESVLLVGFGTFETRGRAARIGRNPQSGEEIKIPASVVPAFKAGKKLKETVAS